MISPIPFWPSFDPCAKLTPVQVRMRIARIQSGGGASPAGGAYNSRRGISTRAILSSSAPTMNPTSGEMSSDLPTLAACSQSTPLVADPVLTSWFASPTPMIDPINVWELDDGKPKYQVP